LTRLRINQASNRAGLAAWVAGATPQGTVLSRVEGVGVVAQNRPARPVQLVLALADQACERDLVAGLARVTSDALP
jgi:Tfp pilus assembly protein PilZ